MKIKSCLLVLLAFSLTACTPISKEAKPYQKVSAFMPELYDSQNQLVLPLNTNVKIMISEQDKLQDAVDIIAELLYPYHILTDRHHDYVDDNGNPIVNLKTVNDHYGSETPLQIDERLFELIEDAIEFSKLSDNTFNPTTGTLSDLWSSKFMPFESENTDPEPEQLKQAKGCTIPSNQLDEYIHLDETDHTILVQPYPSCEDRVQINLSAYAKGIILDKIAEQLKTLDTSFLLDAGSSSIITYIPEHQKEEITWNIGTRNVYDPQTSLFAYHCPDEMAISTSGDDNQFFLLKNEDGSYTRRHHILNPNTGISENNWRSVTLISSSNAGILDALSTTIYNLDETEVFAMMQRFEEAFDTEIDFALLQEVDAEKKLVDLWISPKFKDLLIEGTLSENIREIHVVEE